MNSPGTAVVTGATAGIGREFAEHLAARGHDLVLVARDTQRLARSADELRRTHAVAVEVLPADLADRTQLGLVEDRVADRRRPVELLVNNAGFGLGDGFLEHEVEAEQQLLDVLVTAVLRLSHAALGSMTERRRGGLINVSSVGAALPTGTYAAAKAWVTSFGRWAAPEYRSHGITVTTVCPGLTRSEFHPRIGVGRDRAPRLAWMDADAVVRRALADHDRGRATSVPARYRPVRLLGAALPPSAVARLHWSTR